MTFLSKKQLLLLASLLLTPCLKAADTLFVKQQQIPILIERNDNELFLMRLEANQSRQLNDITIRLSPSTPITEIASLKLYYGGTEAHQNYAKRPFAPCEYLTNFTPGKTLGALPSFSNKIAECQPSSNTVTFKANQKLMRGYNYFWVSIVMKPNTNLYSKVSAQIIGAKADSKDLMVDNSEAETMNRRMAIGVRHAGDDGIAAYRIPGLVTTKRGTLLGVYDVRYNNSVDLQGRIDIGLSRSTDKGKTWEPMRIPMSFANVGELPAAQNGVGDPAILVDEQTGSIWIVALWAHGMGNQLAWFSSQQGMSPNVTAQLVMTHSEDDGQTWSAPINITPQVKHPDWHLFFQGPGRGITMKDGTLVFAMQFIDANRMPHSGIIYSKDHGKTWKISNPAHDNTTEAQVVEVTPGVLMLNMRDNRGGSRSVYTTRDMGKTWQEHVSSRSALIEPVCMASLLKVNAKDNSFGKDILLFSNPNSTSKRNNITIQLSLDGGTTWKNENKVLLDAGTGWGYSCLTMIDKETVGILYESSAAHMTFQAIALKDLCNKK